ncbi:MULTISPECIES: SRPBCC family protein [unclassified Nocardioides]|uniref:SRPBCC family protein n=1 Tax=unclassified Nocardioides TaxID=2615069 RepID=UPI003617D9A6
MKTQNQTQNQSQTRIEAVPDLPVIRITREFDAPPERVFRAWTDPDLFVQWVGPRSIDSTIDVWDARTGGEWRYTSRRGADSFGFWGSFHEVRAPERLVQTFSFDGAPDGVSLETMAFEALDGGRCRVVATSVVESIEIRDQILSSGMDVGVVEGYEKLDELLAASA